METNFGLNNETEQKKLSAKEKIIAEATRLHGEATKCNHSAKFFGRYSELEALANFNKSEAMRNNSEAWGLIKAWVFISEQEQGVV